jgi:small RNA 2'-O-methyltransferase
MAIIDLKSKNPDVSWVIYKNPLTQNEQKKPFIRPLRKGQAIGWYNDNQGESFRIWFKEGSTQSSFYKYLDNGYLDQSAYNCPYVYCALIGEMLSSTTKAVHEKDKECENQITLSAVLITLPNVAQFFVRYFADKVSITMTPIAKKVYEISFSGKVSLFYLVNLVQIFCLMQSVEDRNIYLDLSASVLTKYATALKNINAPYFIVYLFMSRCVPDAHQFNKIKPVLEQDGWVLHYGNTQKQRFDAIKKHVQKGHLLNDIGCGELYYSRHFSGSYEKVFAWDADEAIQRRNGTFIVKKNLSNIELKPAFTQENALEIEEGSDILITEMLEHIPQAQALSILKLLVKQKFRRMIITLPNHEFNQFYKLEHEFRHDDHCWEPDYQQTVDFIHLATADVSDIKVQITPVGDGINNIHVSTMIVIDKEVA